MRRRLIVLLAATIALVTLLASPATAQREDDLIGGNTSGLDGTLKPGCHQYFYAYAVEVPTNDWSMEVSIVDRRGKAVASFALLGPADPKTDTSSFTLCRGATVPGKFRIRSLLNWYDDPAVAVPAYVPVTKFRLARP